MVIKCLTCSESTRTVFHWVKFKCQFPVCKRPYLPDPGAGALCSADLNRQASLPELLRVSTPCLQKVLMLPFIITTFLSTLEKKKGTRL